MEFVAIFALFHVVVIGACWKFARRKLSDREMLAWQWREAHPYASWFRIVFATGLLMTILASVVFFTSAAAVRTVTPPSAAERLSAAIEPALMTICMSIGIGTIVFAFWYWNGLALYRGRLLETARTSLISDRHDDDNSAG